MLASHSKSSIVSKVVILTRSFSKTPHGLQSKIYIKSRTNIATNKRSLVVGTRIGESMIEEDRNNNEHGDDDKARKATDKLRERDQKKQNHGAVPTDDDNNKVATEEQNESDADNPRVLRRKAKKLERKTKALELSTIEKLQNCVKEAISTGSVITIEPALPNITRNSRPNHTADGENSQLCGKAPNYTHVQVITTCSNELPLRRIPDKTTIIRIKPLLILDINGILCHRIRHHKEHPNLLPKTPEQFYRPVIANIANTPIIPRIDLYPFLEFLDKNFCLALWTSAKAKNAKLFIKLLIPKTIADRLLFVWAQNDCIQWLDEEGETIFVKDLQKVWNKYPLWNVNNTLLVDDSPEKCFLWKENAIHPPAMNGIQNFAFRDPQYRYIFHNANGDPPPLTRIPDELNSTQQKRFLDGLVRHWTMHHFIQEWDTEANDSILFNKANNFSQFDFLRYNAP